MADTICSRFLQTCERNRNRVALRYKKGKKWTDLSWQIYRDSVESLAAGLGLLGVQPGDRIAILSSTRYEWAIADMAIMSLSSVTVPIYHNATPEDLKSILQDSQPTIIICENTHQLRALNETIQLPSLRILIDGDESEGQADDALLLSEVSARGEEHIKLNKAYFNGLIAKIEMHDIACIHYTSGTSGRPKGVVLSHTQIMSEAGDAFPLLGVNVHDRSLTFLPFAHVLGHIEIWGHALIGFTMCFAENIERIKSNLIEVKPTIMVSVPRIFEKIYDGIQLQVELMKWKRKAFDLALNVGKQVSQYRMHKQPLPMDLRVQYEIAKKLVFDPITAKLGGCLRFAVCGGAPLNQQIAEFFGAIGVLILEGYGLSETSAAICVNTPFDYRFGTVGKPVGDVKLKFAPDGEILVQSKKVMLRYYNDEASTQEVLPDGWLRTGDIGELTADGFVRITDRKKDLIKTAGGKYIAPQKLEGILKMSPYVSNVHIHGDQKKYAVALVTIKVDAVEVFAREKGIKFSDTKEFAAHPKVYELIRQAVANANSQLASYETVKNFAILQDDFTIEAGELTPSLKVKRKVVDQKFQSLIEQLYV